MKKLLLSLILIAGCQLPPETEPRPERAEVRVVYVYIDRDDCMRGFAPSYMHCDWGFYGRNRYNSIPMMRTYVYPRATTPPNRVEPRRGTPPQRPEGARTAHLRVNRPQQPHNRPAPLPIPPKKPDA